MPPHHEHPGGQLRFVELLELRFNVVNGRAQRTGQAKRFVQSQLALGSDKRREVGCVAFKALMRGLRLLGECAETAGHHHAELPVKVTIDDSDKLRMGLGVGFIAACLKVLLGTARLKHFDGELLVEISHRARVGRRSARGVLRQAASAVYSTHSEKADEPDGPDSQDSVGEANSEAAHGGSPRVVRILIGTENRMRHAGRRRAASVIWLKGTAEVPR